VIKAEWFRLGPRGKPSYPMLEALLFLCLIWLGTYLAPDRAAQAGASTLVSPSLLLSSALLSLSRIFLMLSLLATAEGLPALGFRRLRQSDFHGSISVAMGMCGSLILVLPLELLSYMLTSLICPGSPGMDFNLVDNPLFSALTRPSASPWLMLPCILLLCLCTGYSEELFFRVYLIQRFSDAGLSSIWACAAAALIFGGAHSAQGAHGIIATSAIGFWLCYCWIKQRNYHALALGHALYDFIAILLALYARG